MNSFINHNKQFFSLLLGLLLNSALHAITFRNEPLSNFVQPGEMLYATFAENNFVMLQMENDDLDMIDGDIENLADLKEVFQEAMDNRSGMSINSRECNLSSNIANYNSASLGGTERMDIKGKTSLMFTRCFLKSPFISITGHTMDFVDSFLINPEILNIILDYPESDLKMIQIIFYDQPENPTVITGAIDLEDNQTRKTLIISNIKEIRLQFNSRVWNKSTSEDLHCENPAVVSSDLASNSVSIEENEIASIDLKPKVVAPAKVNRRPNSAPAGIVERSMAAIVAFSEKYLRPYL